MGPGYPEAAVRRIPVLPSDELPMICLHARFTPPTRLATACALGLAGLSLARPGAASAGDPAPDSGADDVEIEVEADSPPAPAPPTQPTALPPAAPEDHAAELQAKLGAVEARLAALEATPPPPPPPKRSAAARPAPDPVGRRRNERGVRRQHGGRADAERAARRGLAVLVWARRGHARGGDAARGALERPVWLRGPTRQPRPPVHGAHQRVPRVLQRSGAARPRGCGTRSASRCWPPALTCWSTPCSTCRQPWTS